MFFSVSIQRLRELSKVLHHGLNTAYFFYKNSFMIYRSLFLRIMSMKSAVKNNYCFNCSVFNISYSICVAFANLIYTARYSVFIYKLSKATFINLLTN